jgi:hypothetical protein
VTHRMSLSNDFSITQHHHAYDFGRFNSFDLQIALCSLASFQDFSQTQNLQTITAVQFLDRITAFSDPNDERLYIRRVDWRGLKCGDERGPGSGSEEQDRQ